MHQVGSIFVWLIHTCLFDAFLESKEFVTEGEMLGIQTADRTKACGLSVGLAIFVKV